MNTWPILVTFVVLLLSAWLLAKRFQLPERPGRFASIDGLRGYLAFGVFVHHGAIWFEYLRTQVWRTPLTPAYANLGNASVALFFMITAFLFWTKLLQGRATKIDWFKLFASRVLRLQVLYYCVVAVMLLIVAVLTSFQLQVPVFSLCKTLFRWATNTGAPDINGLEKTLLITAAVTWTLTYEWMFYLSLPIMALTLGIRVPWKYIIGTLIILSVVIYLRQPALIFFRPFFGGILAATLANNNLISRVSRGKPASVLAAVLLFIAIAYFPSSYEIIPLVLLTVVFIIIVGGNTLFGLLEWSPSIYIGQLTYSIYLLHGLILFVIFRFILGFEQAAALSFTQHWLIMWCCIPVILLICTISFHWIELPGINSLTPLSNWRKKHFEGDANC